MDGQRLVETLTDRTATELDRLGSEKALVATTEARLDRGHVVSAAVDAERRAAATFDQWAEAETDPEIRAVFERVATQERDHAERAAALTDDVPGDADPDPDALHDHLRGLETTPERVAAGLVARPLVSARSLLQVVNFFVNEADETAADTFRTLRAETEALVDEGADHLDACCAGEADWERALAAAERTVEIAYEAYERRLDGLGIDPKPVC
jgi:rubrerythrin